jgi:hypothetical protein
MKRVAFLVVVLGVGVLLHWPSLFSGLQLDDYIQQQMLEGSYPVARSVLDLYTFARPNEVSTLVDAGTLPWWAPPELKLAVLRPLSSALIWLDARALGLSPFARHVHSLLWWVGLVVGFSCLMRELLPRGADAWATLIFAIDPAHATPVSWLANRNELVSACFGVLGLWAFIRWRERKAARFAGLSALGFAAALAGGEYGFAMLGYALSYEVFVVSGPLRARVVALLPAVVPAVIYLIVYEAFDYGAVGWSSYVSPLSAPLDFLQSAIQRLPALLADELLLVPADLTAALLARDYAKLGLLIVPLAIVALLFNGVLRRSDTAASRRLACLAAGMLLAVVPLLGTTPSTRLLEAPSIGGSALFGTLFWDVSRRAGPRNVAFWSRSLATLWLGFCHIVFASYVTRLNAKAARSEHDFRARFYGQVDSEAARRRAQDWILINADDLTSLLYVPQNLREQGHPPPRLWRALAMTERPIRVVRTAPDTLELTVEQGSLTEGLEAKAFRHADLTLKSGTRIVTSRMTVDVLAATPSGPRRARYRFAEPLHQSSIALFALSPTGLRRIAPPAIGHEIVIPVVKLLSPWTAN